MKKVVIVGGVAGGASCAARIRRLDGDAQIIMFEKGQFVSFSNCSLPYYLGGVIEKEDDLLMMTPAGLKKRFNIDVRTLSEVIRIDRASRMVLVRDLANGNEYFETYDKLVLAPGSDPIRPASINGIDSDNVFTVRYVDDVVKIKNQLSKINNIAVVGGGFIGMEVAENLVKAGKQVTLIEAADQVMAPFDYDIAQYLHKELLDHGIDLRLETELIEVNDSGIVVKHKGANTQIDVEAIVLSIGVKPDIKLAKEAGLECRRGIVVDHNYLTSDPDIYAVGDAIEGFKRFERAYGSVGLAGPAQKQARAAADHICGIYNRNRGFLGSSCIKAFDLNAACTGLNENRCKALGLNYDYAYVLPSDKVGIMPDSHYMAFKLLFEVPTGKILGAQAIGKGDVTKRIDVVAAMISMDAYLDDLKDLDICYSPAFNTAKGIENIAALVGLNILYGRVKQVHVSEVRALVEKEALIIDVREPGEYSKGHIKGAVSIPLSQFSGRISEIPKDVPVYLHCRTSQRSYYAICQLQAAGYSNVYNISGSFLGICLYEYFNDVVSHRTPIVTNYNFD